MGDIRWVPQEDLHGCGVACFAMLTGRTYADARALFPGEDWQHVGFTHFTIDWLLAEDGYAVARMYETRDGEPRDVWPVTPFADMHLCQVRVPGGSHFVVMLSDGMVLDPATPTLRFLTDYEHVYSVAAVVPFETPRQPARRRSRGEETR